MEKRFFPEDLHNERELEAFVIAKDSPLTQTCSRNSTYLSCSRILESPQAARDP